MQRAILRGAVAAALVALGAASWAEESTAGIGTRPPAGATSPSPGSDPTNPNGSAVSAGSASGAASGAAPRKPARPASAASGATR